MKSIWRYTYVYLISTWSLQLSRQQVQVAVCSRIRGISEGYLRQEDFEILGARSNPRKSGKIGRKKEFEDGKSCGVQKGGGKRFQCKFCFVPVFSIYSKQCVLLIYFEILSWSQENDTTLVCVCVCVCVCVALLKSLHCTNNFHLPASANCLLLFILFLQPFRMVRK